MKKCHPESLLHIPLVRQMLRDPALRLVPRAVDQNWYYQKALPQAMTGFNPFLSSVFYAQKSCFADWLRRPEASARLYNTNDNLMREVLFAVHDYLHVWAFRMIQALMPELGFGIKPITAKNYEVFVFCHLLTEAVAVIGLDYWFLATTNINRHCDIGTNQRSLTVSYHEDDLREYRRFHPRLNVQDPKFVWELTKFYCNGTFVGFDIADFRASPKLLSWLTHELRYGVNQRRYARQWFAYMSEKVLVVPAGDPTVSVGAKWQKGLATELGRLLWEKVKDDKLHDLPKVAQSWRAPVHKSPDFRFLNLNALKEQEWSDLGALADGDFIFDLFFYQLVASHDFSSFPLEQVDFFDAVMRKKSPSLARSLFKNAKRLSPQVREPRDLFLMP